MGHRLPAEAGRDRGVRTVRATEAPVRLEYCDICDGRIWLKAKLWVHDTGRSMSQLVEPHTATPRPIRGRESQR